MRSVAGISKLNLTMALTTALVFGVVAGILGAILWLFGVQGGWLLWLGVSLLMLGLQWYFGPNLIKWMTRAREVPASEAPQLHAMVEELARKAGLPKPTLLLVQNPTPNAFAFGRTQSSSHIAVHTGLLEVLDKDEAYAVLAHEMGHIKHRDVAVMTLASSVPVLLYYAVLIFGGRGDRDRGIGSFIAVFLGAMLAQFLGQLLVMWLSRQREYYADAFSAYTTDKPNTLMRALVKISYDLGRAKPQPEGQPLKAFYIADPAGAERQSIAEIAQAIDSGDRRTLEEAIENEKKRGIPEWLMTHPLTAKRLEALMKMQAG